MVSCIEEHILPLDELAEKPPYFIECYLIPNDLFKLSATKLQAINEDYILDYSLDFDVKIDTTWLLQGLYRDEYSTYIYNYGHWNRFQVTNKDFSSLLVITPENDTVIGTTTIPEFININDAKGDDENVTISFELDKKAYHNYYISNLQCYKNDSVKTVTKYNDLSHLEPIKNAELKIRIPCEQYDSIVSVVMRLTEENYNYQISLNNAKDSNDESLVQPASLNGNLINSAGIFTCYTVDTLVIYQ